MASIFCFTWLVQLIKRVDFYNITDRLVLYIEQLSHACKCFTFERHLVFESVHALWESIGKWHWIFQQLQQFGTNSPEKKGKHKLYQFMLFLEESHGLSLTGFEIVYSSSCKKYLLKK